MFSVLDVAIKVAQVEEEWTSFVVLYNRERALLNKAAEFPVAH
jgi:hypothetical protein